MDSKIPYFVGCVNAIKMPFFSWQNTGEFVKSICTSVCPMENGRFSNAFGKLSENIEPLHNIKRTEHKI